MANEPRTLLVAADMSQLEIRIAAFMSRDPVMIDILKRGRDMHCVTAAAIYGVDEHRCRVSHPHECIRPGVTDAMRDNSKVWNYMANYGGKAGKGVELIEKAVLERGLDIPIPSLDEAKYALNVHHRLYAQYWNWVGWTITRARINGCSETAFGRPRYSDDINSRDDYYRTSAERALVNHCIQGTAGDMIKMAQVNISRDALMCERGRMLLQVHDEIVSVVQREHVPWYEARIAQHMELGQPFEPYVSLIVDVKSAFRWKDCHK